MFRFGLLAAFYDGGGMLWIFVAGLAGELIIGLYIMFYDTLLARFLVVLVSR